MQFDLSQLLTGYYFFDRAPGGEFLWGYALLVFFVLILFTKSIVMKFVSDDKYLRKSLRKKFGRFVALGVIGIFLVASRFSGIPVFSMRLWLYLTLLLTVGIGIWTFVKIRREYQKRISSVERETGKRM
ncbi:hypothetical protein K9L27_02865 [Candidatus Gracilibacteria bacterium]|nr:hypothetical protein [Candidatus Gracilibacteria bacterium]